MKKSKMCEHVQKQNGRPSRYVKTKREDKKDTETQRNERTPPETKKDVGEDESIVLCNLSLRNAEKNPKVDCNPIMVFSKNLGD